MAAESRFDWPAIFRAVAIIVAVPALLGFLIPVVGALALDLPVRVTSANEVYRFAYWLIVWGLIVWQGSWMLREVHDRIIDDMLVTSTLSAVILLIIKVVMAFVFDPRPDYVDASNLGPPLPIVTAIDAGGAMVTVVVALIAARVNKF